MPHALIAPVIGAGISGLAGLFGGGKQQETKSSKDETQTQNYSQSGTSATTANLNPFQQQLAQLFTKGAIDSYNTGTNLAPYSSAGLQGLAKQGDTQSKIISNILAQRGLSYSPAAATGQIMNTMDIGGKMSNFLSGIPLLAKQLQQQGLDNMMKAFSTQPITTSTATTGTGSSTMTDKMTGTNVQSGNPLAGLFGGIGAGMFAPGGILNPK